jgi:integrase
MVSFSKRIASVSKEAKWVKEDKRMSLRYQRGSLRREKRAGGNDVWVWRFRLNGTMKQEKYLVADYKTKSAMWQHLEPAVRALNNQAPEPAHVAPTMNDVIKRYMEQNLPHLAKSTQNTQKGQLLIHIGPKWGEKILTEIEPGDVQEWIRTVKLSQVSKGHVMVLMRRLYKLAMLWKMYPVGFNPLTLVEVKGATTREEEPTILTPAKVTKLVEELGPPHDLMVLVTASLGLRVSETLALRWEDFDFKGKTVRVQRAYTHQELKDTKSASSKATVPVPAALLSAMKAARGNQGMGWVFPSPVTGRPYAAGMILQDHIKPAAKKLGFGNVGWHDLRHSFRSWISSKAPTTVQKDMMRHAEESTTANIYGRTPVEEMRPVAEMATKGLRAKRPSTTR